MGVNDTQDHAHMNLNQVYSEFILLQSKENKNPFDLRTDAPLLNILHPKMIMALLEFMHSPESEPKKLEIPGWNYQSFSNLEEGIKSFPKLAARRATPENLGSFLNSECDTALFDFPPFGAFILSCKPLRELSIEGLHQYLIPPFLGYALSAELWGNQGKWPRFHERLHTLFVTYNLLKRADKPGLYPLIPEAQKLEQHGILGTMEDDCYVLTLPWTFPLSALEKLEVIIPQEF